MIRIGIVGCGRILAAHLRGYRLLREAGVEDFKITALCSRQPKHAEMYLQRGKGPAQRPPVSNMPGDPLAIGGEYLSDFQEAEDVRIYSDYREMIADGPVDAINDFSTHALHHQVAALAFEHGKHLLTQKPLALTVKAAKRMCEQAEAKGLTFGVFENARFNPQTRHQRWLMESGRCGQPQMALMGNVGKMWAPNRIVAETPWRHHKLEAGGISLDIGVHQLDMLRHVIGEIRCVSGHARTLEPERVTLDGAGRVVERIDCDADDTFYANIETDRGATGNLFGSWGGHGGPTVLGRGPVLYGSGGRVNGTQISLDDGTHADLTELYEYYCDPMRREQDFPLGLDNGFALAQHDWLRAVRHGEQPETHGREGLRDLACAFAILESSEAGRTVEVEEVLSGELDTYQRPIDEHFGIA